MKKTCLWLILLLLLLAGKSLAGPISINISPTSIDVGTVQFTEADYADYGKFTQQTNSLLIVCNSQTNNWHLDIQASGDFTRNEGGLWNIELNRLKGWGWIDYAPGGAWVFPRAGEPNNLDPDQYVISTVNTTLFRGIPGNNQQLEMQFGLWVPIQTAAGNYSTTLTFTMTED